jgi:hypothetical protein
LFEKVPHQRAMRKGIVASVRTLLGKASQGAERRSGPNEGSAEEDQGSRRGGAQGELASDHQGVRTLRTAEEMDASRRSKANTAAGWHSDRSTHSRHQSPFYFPRHQRLTRFPRKKLSVDYVCSFPLRGCCCPLCPVPHERGIFLCRVHHACGMFPWL